MSKDYRKIWERMEFQLPNKTVKQMPSIFVIADEDYDRLAESGDLLPRDNGGLMRYKGIPVLPESEVAFIAKGTF